MSSLKYVAPKFGLTEKRIYEIPFNINVAATTYLSQVSGRIMFKFRVLKAKMFFPEEANNLVEHGWFIDSNRSVSTTGTPSGDNAFHGVSPTNIFTGKAVVRVAESNREFEEEGLFIKFYTYNGNAYAYQATGSITIEEID